MNTQPQTPSLPAEPPVPQPAITTLHPATGSKRRTSKIARLPKKLRDLINDRLSDGATYDQIVLVTLQLAAIRLCEFLSQLDNIMGLKSYRHNASDPKHPPTETYGSPRKPKTPFITPIPIPNPLMQAWQCYVGE